MNPVEKFVLSILKLNAMNPPIEIRKEKIIFGFRFIFNWRSKKNFWGRFGGGWNWEFGFQIGGKTILLMLLICTIRIDKVEPKKILGDP